MVVEHLTDPQRQLLVVLVTQAYVRIQHDPDMLAESDECEHLIRVLSGTDTRVMVERASQR